MTRLLIITPKYPPQSGGAAYVFSLIGENIKQKLDYVEVFTSTYNGSLIENRQGIKITRLFSYIEKVPAKIFFAPLTFTITFLYFLLNSRKFDVVESHTVGEISIFSQFMARLFGKKLIKHVIDMQTNPFFLKHPYAEGFICCGQTIAKKLQGIGISKNMINDINLPIIKSNINPKIKTYGKKTFVFIGELSEQKGVRDILDTMRELKGKKFKIMFIGSGPLEEEIKYYAEYDKRIKFFGYLSHKDVIKILARTDVLIHPTRSDVMPLSILEAMMMGNVILSTDIGEIKKTVGNGGIIIKPGDRESLKNAFLFLLKSRIECIKKNAMKNFEKYASQDVYGMNLAVIEKVKGVV